MAQPLFMVAHRNGALPQVYRVPGASPIPFGDPLPTGIIETGTSLDDSIFTNRAVQFQGDVYAVAVNGVYKKTDPTSDSGAWTQNHAFTGVVGATENFHLHGPYQIVLGGVSSLFVMWGEGGAATNWNASFLNGNTDVWSDVGIQAGVTHGATNSWGKQIVYRGVWYGVSDTGIMTFDPGAASFGTISAGPISRLQRVGFGIFNDRLLLLGRSTATGFVALYEIVGGAVAHLFDTTFADLGGDAVTGGRYALFPDPGGVSLYGLATSSTGGTGTIFMKFIDTAGTISFSTDLSNPVLPAGLRAGGGTTVDTNRWWVHYDQETAPGIARLVIYHAPDGSSGSILTQYVFVDESTEIAQEDTGANAAWAFSNVMTGGGERIFTPGELNIEITDRIAILGGQAVRFKCYGQAGADKQVDFRRNTQTEVPLTVATLIGVPSVISGPAPAPTRSGNVLQGVTADGATLYETTWDIGTDGVPSGSRAQLAPRIFV